MAEYTAVAPQTINPGESWIFTATTTPCNRGLVRHSDGTSTFLLSGWTPFNNSCRCCGNGQSVDYLIDFKGNIAVAEGGTAGPISVAITVDGSTVPASTMISTPTAAEAYNNVSVGMSVPIFSGCCQTVAVTNTSNQPILAQQGLIRITRPDLYYSR